MPVRSAARRWIALPVVLVGLLLPAAAAQADLGLSGASVSPSTRPAGTHQDFTLTFATPNGDHIKDVTTQLPPGLVGNPQSAGFCVPAQLMNNACPPNSIIGQASSNVTATLAPPLPATLPLSASGNVYNMIPQGSDPATLGIVLVAVNASPLIVSDPVILIGHASARSTDFGLNTTINNIPQTASITAFPGTLNIQQTSPVHIDSTTLTLFGNTAGRPQFITNPTSCGAKTVDVFADSYEHPSTVEHTAANFNSTACDAEQYHPNLGVTIDLRGDAQHVLHPDLTTDVTQGLNEANSKRVEAILPATIQANNAALNHQCPPSSFPLDPTVSQSCPANTQVGTAVARTPLLSQPLQGPVYLIQNAGLLPKVGLDLKGPLPARILGNATPTADLRLDNVFGDVPPGLPDVPLSSFKLTFAGGDGGLVTATDSICDGPSAYNANFDSFGGQHVAQQSNATVIGCDFAKRLAKGRCDGKKLTDVGTNHHDVIKGTKKRDVINGEGGNDTIIGLGGNDILCGGKGNDTLKGGKGKDQLFGGPGKDKLLGGPGKDRLAGGAGKDIQKQ